MVARPALDGFLIVAGVVMLSSARTTPFAVLLLAVGLSSLVLPSTRLGPRTD